MTKTSNLFNKLNQLYTQLLSLLFPPVIERTPEHQKIIDEQTKYLVLYHFPGCPYCTKIKRLIHQLSLKIELRDARHNQEYRNELINHGGKAQVPCLHIQSPEGDNQWLYESGAINNLLKQRFMQDENSTR
ncbi:MAG: glutaredoxin [Gammaproteobacteria bacterium]|nr:glutaredoxin [Gammaproteobacteria bacterium]